MLCSRLASTLFSEWRGELLAINITLIPLCERNIMQNIYIYMFILFIYVNNFICNVFLGHLYNKTSEVSMNNLSIFEMKCVYSHFPSYYLVVFGLILDFKGE